MANRVTTAVMCTVLPALTIFLGCGAGSPKNITSSDGAFQITVSNGMTKTTKLHEDAHIQAANEYRELYVIVISEKLSDYPFVPKLEVYSEKMREHMLSNMKGSGSPAREEKINGNRAIVGELHGISDGVDCGFVYGHIQTKDHYHQVITWTLKSKFPKHKETLYEILRSFKPVSDSE
jgi:hypothetical protein